MTALNSMHVKTNLDKEDIPALDPSRAVKMDILAYRPLRVNSDEAEVQEWMETLSLIETDLRTVLCLPHDLFWCQAVFDESLHRCVESYLQHAPRKFDKMRDLRAEGKDKLAAVHRLVFMVCLRMSTHKESKEGFIDPSVFGEIIYENYLFDIPKLMDISVLYGSDNLALVSKMVTNVFTQQPMYWNDLQLTASTIQQVLETIMQECGVNQHPDNDLPRQLAQKPVADTKLVEMSPASLRDIVAYLCDVAVTLAAFCDVFTPACDVLYGCGFAPRLAFFYDVIMCEVKAVVQARPQDATVRSQLHMAKKHLISSFHQIVQAACITPILDQERSSDCDKKIDDFLHTLSQVIEYRRFIADYESYHPFEDVVDMLTQINRDIDTTRISYIQDAINHAFATYGRRKKPTGHRHVGGRGSPDGSPGEATEAIGGQQVVENGHDSELEGACAARVTGIELDSMITSVRDLLPDFGDGFIEVCLEQLGYDTEKVVNALLEDRIPECLQDISRKLERRIDTLPTNNTPLATEDPAKNILDERRCIFDDDEFDVLRRDDVDFDRIHQGKRQGNADVLNDKTAIHANRELYNFYGSNDVASAYDRFDMYEDEYDDTYDENEVGAADADSADELTARRQNMAPRVSNNGRREQEESSPDTDEEEKRRKGRNFLEDPATLRKLAEERRMSKQGLQGGQDWKRKVEHVGDNDPGARGANDSGSSGVKYDVKGKARGQGQEGNVVRNRQFKEQNKGRKANHNRRNLADKKRAKGMGPPT